MDLTSLSQNISSLGQQYLPKIGAALIALVIGWWCIALLTSFLRTQLKKRRVESALLPFFCGILSFSLKTILVITILSMLGVQTTSFIAILGAAGLAVGLALQGSLSNFAGGVLILLFKPFRIGDFIDAQGHSGTVKEIQIFNTILRSTDNKTIIIPNGALSNGTITNFSTEKQRRVDFVFGIGYQDDIATAKKVIEDIVTKDNRILKDPAHQIVVGELGADAVNLTVRVWVMGSDYWGVYFDMQEQVKIAFEQKSISIPYPQRDIHVYNEK